MRDIGLTGGLVNNCNKLRAYNWFLTYAGKSTSEADIQIETKILHVAKAGINFAKSDAILEIEIIEIIDFIHANCSLNQSFALKMAIHIEVWVSMDIDIHSWTTRKVPGDSKTNCSPQWTQNTFVQFFLDVFTNLQPTCTTAWVILPSRVFSLCAIIVQMLWGDKFMVYRYI